jgi:sialic acid synthase SpsE/quercetin dioxygenase-like cupin family protein
MDKFTLKNIKPFFIFEMANNHMGSLMHGLKIIRDIHKACKDYPFKFGFKLQYRQLDTFIHPEFQERYEFKYVKRFSETALKKHEFKALKDEMSELDFLTVCTPFDEASVDLLEEHNFDIIKIASCSCTDWPLLERIIKTDKPAIISSAGISWDDLDRVVSFFDHREKDFALMHCVAEYPTITKQLELNQIDLMRRRYPHVMVGYSTHESPQNVEAVKLAVAKGANIFEKHVGIKTDQFPLNDYSASPAQITAWLDAALQAYDMCGVPDERKSVSDQELDSLLSLRRGVFVRRFFKKGEKIKQADMFFAIPTLPDQVTANDISKYVDFYAEEDIAEKKPLLNSQIRKKDLRGKVYEILRNVKKILRESNVSIPPKVDLEVSHHYGMDQFPHFGITMATIVNREYCKKLIVILPGQTHPEQFHKIKEETFHVLHGDVWVIIDGQEKNIKRGDVVVIERGMKHSFGSRTGAVIEEISSTHSGEDSFYTDLKIIQNTDRKTWLTYWFD